MAENNLRIIARGIGFIRAGAVGIRIRKMPAVFFRILGREEKPIPRVSTPVICGSVLPVVPWCGAAGSVKALRGSVTGFVGVSRGGGFCLLPKELEKTPVFSNSYAHLA